MGNVAWLIHFKYSSQDYESYSKLRKDDLSISALRSLLSVGIPLLTVLGVVLAEDSYNYNYN